MVTRLLLALCIVAACRGKESAPKKQEPPVPAPTDAATGKKDPWIQVDAAPDTPEARRKRADAALGRVASIMPELAKLRGLSFDRDIPREYQSADDFKTYVRAEIKKELPPDKSRDVSAAWYHLGLLEKPADLAQLEEQAFTTQAGAYYDPATKKFFLVMVPDSDVMLDTISAHELTHGLQDQHFDLQKYMPDDDKAHPLDEDAGTARRFIAEGDATFTMFLYMATRQMHKPGVDKALVDLLRGQIATFAGMEVPQMVDMNKQQATAFTSMDPEIKKSVEAMQDIPLTVLVPLLDSYMKGALVCLVAYEHGGWPAVNALYGDPPDSTEQVLHPETKMYPKRDKPHRVTLPKLAGYTELAGDVLGELQWSVYFNLWAPDKAKVAAEGWGGDRYSVVRAKDGSFVAAIATVWDTPADAKEFADAYTATTAKRKHDKVQIKTDGAKVFIVDGSTDAKLFDQIVHGSKLE